MQRDMYFRLLSYTNPIKMPILSDKPITEMNASFNYIFDRLCMSYPASEARAIARLVLETRFGLTPIDICMGRDRTFSLEERRDLEIL